MSETHCDAFIFCINRMICCLHLFTFHLFPIICILIIQQVDWTKARVSLRSAIRHCNKSKPLPRKEARNFLDNHMSNVIRILLVEFDVGQHLLQSDRARIKSDLVLALETISHDLEHATMEEGICCRTLPVLMDVFDETIYYESNELISKFRQTGGLFHLGKYLIKTASAEFFPGLDQVSAILTLVGKVLGEEIDKKEHMTTCESVLDISNGIIENMKHFKQEKLARLSDDVMDICRRVCAIYADVGGIGMTSIVNVYCDFVLSMVQSPSAQLKDFGWKQLCNIIERVLKDRQPPRAYIVQDAGDDFVNGKYELANIKNTRYDVYTRQALTLTRNFGCWFISGTHRRDQSREEKYYIHYYIHNTPPCTGWEAGFDPPPTVIPVDFDDISPTENNLLQWMLQSNLLEIFANEADSNCTWRTKHSVFYSIEQLLSLILQTPFSRNYQPEADSYLDLVDMEKMIMRALLRLSPDSMKKIGMHFISGIFKQLKEVIRITDLTDQRHRKVDFQIFNTLMTMRGLKDKQNEKMIFGGDQDNDCYEDDPLLAQAYFFAGAGSSDGNGLYVLDRYRTMDDYDISYTQMYINDDGKESALLKMHQCLDGPD